MRRLHLTHLNISSTHFFSLKITAPKPQSYTSACTRRRRNKKKHPQRACIMHVHQESPRLYSEGEERGNIYIKCVYVFSLTYSLSCEWDRLGLNFRLLSTHAGVFLLFDAPRLVPLMHFSLYVCVCVCIYVNIHMYLLVCSSLVVSMRERKPIMRALRSPAYEVANFRSISHSARAFGFPFFVRAPRGSCELKILMESKMHHGVLR